MIAVLLIQPPIEDFYLTEKRTIPYGLACIAGALRQQNISVAILDALACQRSKEIPLPQEMQYLSEYYIPDRSPYNLFYGYKHFGYSWEYLSKRIKEHQPFLVGISSLCTAYSQESLKIAEITKKVCPNAKIVAGGHHATALPETLLAHSCIDYCLRGEGEISLPKLVVALQQGLPLESVPGIAFRKLDGTLHVSPPAIVENLDQNPLPALDLVANKFYQRRNNSSAVVVASRGCPMRCSYCSVSSGSWLKYRRRSVNSVLSEIELAVSQFQANFLDFEDENIAMEREWFLELLARIQQLYGQQLELRAMNGLYPPTLDEEIIKQMKQAGFRALNLSLGTISPTQLERFQRPNVQAAFEKALQFGKQYSLKAVGYIIIAAPNQSAEESLSDMIYLAQQKVLIGTSVYYPAPASKDYRHCQQQKLLPTSLSLLRATALPLDYTTTRLQAITLLRLSRIINFMKSLIDQEEDIQSIITSQKDISQFDSANRIEMGKYLLSLFFKDAQIHGVYSDGNIFVHKTDKKLCEIAARNLRSVIMQGT